MITRYLDIRKKLYNEIYAKHRATSKISKLMYYQPIDNWKKHPYLKFKYWIIIELASILSWALSKKNFNPDSLTIFNIFLAIIAFIFFSSPIKELNYIAFLIFFLKNVIDYSDGFIARNLKKTSLRGAFLDEWSGNLFHFAFLAGLPIFTYNKTFEINYLYISIGIILFYLLSPKNRILSYDFLKNTNDLEKNEIIKIFANIKKIKDDYKKKKTNIKIKIVKFFSFLEYSGRTKYTDFIIFLLLIENYFESIYFTNYICWVWLFVSLVKFVFFFFSIIRIKE